MSFSDDKSPTSFSGVTVAAILLPVALIVYHYADAEKAVSTFMFLGAVVFAATIRWNLRTHVWFWVVLAVVAALHLPLIIGFEWPVHSVHTILLLPIFIVDLLIVLGIISVAEALCLPKKDGDSALD